MIQADPLSTELSNLLKRGDVTVFIGAGISIGAGLPGWGALIRPLAQSVGYRLPTEDEFTTADLFLTAAQHYENQRGRQALIQNLRDTLDTTRIRPTSVHQLIASLPVKIFFTTNYDDFIEQALREISRRPNVIVSESELAFWSEDRAQIIKLCGDLNRPESIILTKRDFNTYIETHRRLVERLRTTLEAKTALFLGYSLQDPFFNQIWDNIGLDLGRSRRMGYAVLFDAQTLEVDDLRQRGIHVINLETRGRERTELLMIWLSSLLETAPLLSSPGQPAQATSVAPDLGLKPPVQPETVEQAQSPDPSALRQVLTRRYNLEELRTLCFDLDVNYDSLGGEGLDGKVRELIAYMHRHGELVRLVSAIRKDRGDII
jgi:hypothetical protein